MWGMVGENLPRQSEESSLQVDASLELAPYVYTETYLRISYNEDRIVKVDLLSRPDSLVPILKMENKTLHFSLQVEFETTDETYEERFDRYMDHEFFSESRRGVSFTTLCIAAGLIGAVITVLKRALASDEQETGDQDVEAPKGESNERESGARPLLTKHESVLYGKVFMGTSFELHLEAPS